MKYIFLILISVISYSYDFRNNTWGDSPETVIKNENLKEISYKESFKSKTFSTFKGDSIYNYNIEEYSFPVTLESLGEFRLTYSFIKNKLFKATYLQEIKNNEKSCERMKQYLIWKYGENYKTYAFYSTYEWNSSNSKIVLNIQSNGSFSVEYYCNIEDMNLFISNTENGREFIKNLNSEFSEFNKIKDNL